MSKDKDKFIPDEDLELEAILAEFSSKGPPTRNTPEEPPAPEGVDLDLPWPEAKRRSHRMVDFPAPPAPEAPPQEPAPSQEPAPGEAARPADRPAGGKVLSFPGADPVREEPPAGPAYPLEEEIGRLKEKADRFADQMFADEGVEVAEGTRRAERLIPGVDEEQLPPPGSRRERKPRRPDQRPPDTSPGELYSVYNKRAGALRLRWLLATLICLPQLWLMLAPLGLPLPPQLEPQQVQCYVSLGLFLVSALLGLDVWGGGLLRLFRGRPGMDTLLACAVVATAVDAATAETLAPRAGQLPYCGVAAAAVAFALRGEHLKQRGLRLSCRVAATAQEPYLVTLDEAKWNGRATYVKHAGPISGFGSQIQGDDGAQRTFRVVAPVVLVACIALSLLASVGKGRAEYLPWCLSATFTAAASFSAALAFGKPFYALSRRLSGSGAALAGWEGVEENGKGILVTDTDLFPPGTVSVNGIKVFGNIPLEKMVALTATLIRQSGSGLDKLFRDQLRAQGGAYRRCDTFECYEGGGMAAMVRGERVLVGNAAFMALMDIAMPTGTKLRNAVFCAVDGELAGIFALNYTLHGAIPPALYALIQNKVTPVLATRDFNIIPAMLHQRFKLPVEKMEYPAVERRLELSDEEQPHSQILTAVLCREGLLPLSEAVVGGQRLRRATRLNCVFTCLGSMVGVLLSFYLTVNLAFSSLSALNLFLFLLLWVVPAYLISGWVNRY